MRSDRLRKLNKKDKKIPRERKPINNIPEPEEEIIKTTKLDPNRFTKLLQEVRMIKLLEKRAANPEIGSRRARLRSEDKTLADIYKVDEE